MKRALLYAAISVFGAILVVAAIEGQYVGLAISTVDRWGSEPPGASPAEIIAQSVAGDGTTTLLAAGDIADCAERPGFSDKLPNTAHLLGLPSAFDASTTRARETAALAGTMPDVPLLALGDIVYGHGSPAEFENCFDPVWVKLKPRTLPTPGNHEYRTPAAFGYYDYWGAQAGPDRRGYYAGRVPGWLILSLNSEIDAGPKSAQAAWLHEQLDASPEACVLGFYHKPAYSLVERDGRAQAVNLFRELQRGGASLVLNGHNHFYERTKPLGPDGDVAPGAGTVAFTIGTGGRVEPPLQPVPETAASVFEHTGMLRLDLREGAYDWAFLDARTGEIFDQGSRPCNPARSREE